MAEGLQKEITNRLKRINCQQSNCRNNGEDNIDLIVFGKPDIKKSGFMCSECFIDTELLNQLTPIQKHSISIRKFMKTLTEKYLQYSQEKQSLNWGPNFLDRQKSEIKDLLAAQQQFLFKSCQQLFKFIENQQTQTLEQIRVLHSDKDFDKLCQLLNQQDQDEQQKKNVSKQLKTLSGMIMLVQGQLKLSNQNQIKQKHESIMLKYRRSMDLAKKTLQSLFNLQKQTLKELYK